jgi:hypothetical protein
VSAGTYLYCTVSTASNEQLLLYIKRERTNGRRMLECSEGVSQLTLANVPHAQLSIAPTADQGVRGGNVHDAGRALRMT